MAKNARNRFLKNAKRLSQLYDFSMHSYAHVLDDLRTQIASGEMTIDTMMVSKHGFAVHHRVGSVLGHGVNTFPKELRSIILVRLVSEFEVFLIDQIEETGRYGNVAFRDDARLDWDRSRLLSFNSLAELKQNFRESDCRVLSSGGFDEIRKYYQKHLKFDVCPPGRKIEVLREIHARRHLHVHNLGMVDHQYRHEFNAKLDVGTYLPVTDAYLQSALALFRETVHHIAVAAAQQFPIDTPRRINGTESILNDGRMLFCLRAKFKDENASASYFNPDRLLNSGIKFGDLFLGAECVGKMCDWSIVGNTGSLKAFFQDLHVFERKGLLKVVDQRRVPPKSG